MRENAPAINQVFMVAHFFPCKEGFNVIKIARKGNHLLGHQSILIGG